jgi:hypothetical protein
MSLNQQSEPGGGVGGVGGGDVGLSQVTQQPRSADLPLFLGIFNVR